MVYRRTARSEKAREASREALLAAATRLVRKRGYQGTTMQDVVAEAGTSIGNAYFYFRNKDELFAETVRRAVDARWGLTEKLMVSAPAGPRRVALIIYANILGTLGQDVHFARAIVEVQSHLSYLREVSLARWRPILAECCPELGERERELVATTIWGSNRTHGERMLDGSLESSPLEIADFAVRWNLRALGIEAEEREAAQRFARRAVMREFSLS